MRCVGGFVGGTRCGSMQMICIESVACVRLKHIKQQSRHPLKQFVAECRSEWEACACATV